MNKLHVNGLVPDVSVLNLSFPKICFQYGFVQDRVIRNSTPTSLRSECVPPAIVICRCKLAEHKFRSLTIAERPSASKLRNVFLDSFIEIYMLISNSSGKFLCTDMSYLSQIQTQRGKKRDNSNKATARIIIPKSQEKLEVAAQIQSRNWYVSTAGSCLKLLPQAPTNWQQGNGKTGREENRQQAYPHCLVLWSQWQGCPLLCCV